MNSVRSKPRYDFYQTPSHVHLRFSNRGVKNPKVEAAVSRDKVQIVFDGEVIFTEKLCGEVLDDARVSLTPSKVEIRFQKKIGEMWPQLEASNPEETKAQIAPTKSKWDAIADAENVNDDEDDSNPFKNIYSSVDDDSKKAMMKSYYESAGTVLSTNWEDVKRQKARISPPDGMEFRKW